MARGSAVNESIQSQAATEEYRSEHERIFGDRPIQRGRWIWDEAQQKLVRAEDYRPPERATNAPILMDRFYENTAATDGTDIGSRRKHRRYMKDRGLAPADDFSPGWYAKEKAAQKREQDRSRRETLGRAIYKMDKP
jgi:hypothetical protein